MRVAELLPNVLKYVTPDINEANMVDLLKNINKYTIVDEGGHSGIRSLCK